MFTQAYAQVPQPSFITIVPGASNPNNPGGFFNPAVFLAHAGSLIRWINNDSTIHTVISLNQEGTQPSGLFQSQIIPAYGQFNSMPLNETGTINYFCSLHPFMTGKIVIS